MDLNRILRMLQPRQEKVIRLYFGLGCQRSHSALEIADAFEVSSQVIAGILGAAERRLARLGLTPIQMRAAARREAALHPAPRAVVAGIQAAVLVRSPRASLVLIRSRSGCGDPLWIPGAFPYAQGVIASRPAPVTGTLRTERGSRRKSGTLAILPEAGCAGFTSHRRRHYSKGFHWASRPGPIR